MSLRAVIMVALCATTTVAFTPLVRVPGRVVARPAEKQGFSFPTLGEKATKAKDTKGKGRGANGVRIPNPLAAGRKLNSIIDEAVRPGAPVAKKKARGASKLAIVQKIPEKNPIADKVRKYDVLGEALGLDFVGLVDWNNRGDFIKKIFVAGLGVSSLGGLALNLFVLPELAKGEEKKTAKAASAKKIEVKAAPAQAKKAELEKKPDKKAEAAAAAAKAAKEKEAAAKAAAEAEAKKKADDDKKAKDKAEKDAIEAKRKAIEDAATADRQRVYDEGKALQTRGTDEVVAGYESRRATLMKAYGFDDTYAKGFRYGTNGKQ